ncbi:MAG: hypothetical protein SGJ21_04530 [Alphaproteobacteria bacterium]|nr:hypothetical protein [Alphaproteobacteria bacterium]
MSQHPDDKRRDDVLKRMLETPPKKQDQLKKELKERREPKPAPKSKGV